MRPAERALLMFQETIEILGENKTSVVSAVELGIGTLFIISGEGGLRPLPWA